MQELKEIKIIRRSYEATPPGVSFEGAVNEALAAGWILEKVKVVPGNGYSKYTSKTTFVAVMYRYDYI